jgi:drug/metabolite transporter (DMT)-like permease
MGYFYAALSAFMAGILIVASKWVMSELSALAMSVLVFPIGSIVLAVVSLPKQRYRRILELDRRAWGWSLAFSGLAFVAIWAHWEGIKLMDPTLASFVNRSETIVTIALGMIFLGERFSKKEGWGATLVLIGIVVMKITFRGEYSTGFCVVLLSALLFGGAEFIAKIAVRYVDPLSLSLIRTVANSVLFGVAALLFGVSFAGLEKVWWGVLLVAIAGPVITRPLYLYALKYLAISKVALINQSQPVFVALLALIALQQMPAPREILGGLFVIGGCLVVIIHRRRQK